MIYNRSSDVYGGGKKTAVQLIGGEEGNKKPYQSIAKTVFTKTSYKKKDLRVECGKIYNHLHPNFTE
ncbi:Hypothetical predicted protein [Octopus vulgaris]|uniref:Uncharacterized protein n=1 Tax=Octopus vulgaris TaxID=6645 RepID=A0AA36BNK5_OCTVU|nr:Hypothetical predicted protein [Octopus vulgaris]